MEKEKKNNTVKKKKEAAKPSKTSKTTFRIGPKLKRIFGLFFLLFSFFIILAMTSYSMGAWKNDAIFSDSTMTWQRIFFDTTIIVQNWMGKIGAALAYILIKQWFGVASYLFGLLFFIGGFRLLFRRTILPFAKTLQLSIILLLLVSVGSGYIFHNTELNIFGGEFGMHVNDWLESILGRAGAGILIAFLYLSFMIVVFNISFHWFAARENEKESAEAVISGNMSVTAEKVEIQPEESPQTFEFNLKEPEPVVVEKTLPENPIELTENKNEVEDEDDVEFEIGQVEEQQVINQKTSTAGKKIHNTLDVAYDPRLELSEYQFPPIDLLANYGGSTTNVKKEELEENKNKIVRTLKNYSIEIDKIIATIGPTVTLYEIIPAPGIRISRIKNLEDDIALSLSAYGIRIIAPIPGKGTIGIEVPNQNPEIVSMKSIIASERFQNTQFELPVGMGKTISNESFVFDLAKMPHLLMAGATGQGKSVGLNAIITSLLYKKHPAEVKFVMVDPKKVELTLFSKIERHFLAKLPDFEEAIITDTRKVVRVLNSLGIEMDSRYNLLKDAQVRNIKEYNTKFISRKLNPQNGHRFLPYIIVVIDEFADLIMTAGKEIEIPLTRIAQLARATGIHLVIATQRPSVNIITGTIKANFPARIAFRVTAKVDSRTILDTGGADQLVGRGDLLLSSGSDLIRLQCAFVDTPEVEKITEFIGSQRAYPDAYSLPEYYEEGDESSKDFEASERDEHFEEAARMIVSYQQGSTSLIQRKLKLGYNRAGRIMDQLEAAGIVGPFEGSKAREVRIKDMQALEQFLKQQD